MTPDTRKILSLLLIPIYLILIAVFLAANIKAVFNPPILLLVFNSLFLGLIPLYVAYVAYISFRGSGSTGVLLKGTGMLVLGLGAIAAGIVNYLPDSMNANITVQNTSFCAAALLQLMGILIALSGTVPQQKTDDGLKVTLLYGGSVVIVFSFTIAAVAGAIPLFFIPGVGFTPLREILITNAIEFFALAAVILLWLYYREREEFFFWYSIGLALIGIGLLAVHFPSVLGSPLGWVGRSAQYLGGVYILIAFMALRLSARQTGIPPGNMLSRFFGDAATSYRALIETATDAIVVFDSADRVIVWNRAAEKMFGYTLAEATGSSFLQRVIPDEFTTIIKSNFRGPVPPHADSALQKSMEITARRKDGSTFPMELALSRHRVGDTWVSTCIIRDLTERKKAEKELMQKNDDLNTAYEEISSTQEELRQNLEELSLREQKLIKSEADLTEALAEKEILLAEIHHRVKNNLTAFISLLSLDGSYEDTEAGQALRKDLQNRARSMALIHETLYQTGKFSNVDMKIYLDNLVSQVASSYAERSRIRLAIEVHEVTLDIARATTAGLIINELVTNSLKYAFPPGFDCMAARGEPCTIRVSLAHDDGPVVLAVADNGCGLPEGFDPLTTKSLGLKLVTFLARHQLRAEIHVHGERGTEFILRLKDTGD
jgi:PAS domain S-box-containing protein